MEFAIQKRGSWEDTLAAARWAEDAGLVAFAMPDHYLQLSKDTDKPAWDHLVHLAALSRETTRVQLTSLVSPVTFRHPAVYYKMAVTLDEVSGGRFALGLGAGWLDAEFENFGIPYPDRAIRFEMLEEALAYLRTAFSPGAVGFAGRHYQLASFEPHPHPAGVKLVVGGEGKVKTPRLAGTYADEFNIYACPPEEFAGKAGTAHDAASSAGRDPELLLLSAAGPAVAAKREGDYRRILGGLAARIGREPEYIEARYRERGYPHGSGAQAAEMIAAFG